MTEKSEQLKEITEQITQLSEATVKGFNAIKNEIYVVINDFVKWWNELSDDEKEILKQLIKQERIEDV